MPTPQNDVYSAPSGALLHAGRQAPPANPWAEVSALLQATDEDSWVQVNAGNFSDAWPPTDALPLKAPDVPTPVAPMVPWASVALDDARGRLFIFGGGHANSNDNSVYTWEATDRRFHLAFMPTDNVLSAVSGLWHNVEDWSLSPPSAHTYANNAYLPRIDRFFTPGGAAWNTGHAYFVTDAEGAEIMPLAGGYTLNMAQAFQGKVGGGTGSNVQRGSTAGQILQGALAWTARPYGIGRPDSGSDVVSTLAGHLDGLTVYREEGGHDVLYVRCSTQVGLQADTLVRVEFVDDDYRHDLLSIVGIPAGGDAYSDQGGALDPVRGLVVNCGYPATPLSFWDLSQAGPGNVCITPALASIGGNGLVSYLAAMEAHKLARPQSYGMGMCFDTERQRFVMWGGLRAVWVAPTPTNLLNGWQINELAVNGSQSPTYDGTETGVHGKFKYSAAMDCYLAVNASGNEIWAYKPAQWNPKV